MELDTASRRGTDLGSTDSSRISLQGAIADVPDSPLPESTTPAPVASLAEQSRWPGRRPGLGMPAVMPHRPPRGVGGYFSPHKYNENFSFDAWAATVDYRIPLFAHLESSGSFYRGLALGGLGGGAFKDYLYAERGTENYYYRPLDELGAGRN